MSSDSFLTLFMYTFTHDKGGDDDKEQQQPADIDPRVGDYTKSEDEGIPGESKPDVLAEGHIGSDSH